MPRLALSLRLGLGVAGIGALACTPSRSQPPGNIDSGRGAISADDASAKGAPTVSVAAPSLPAGSPCPHDVSKAPGASAHGMTIPTGHPRLWWTPERIARAKKWAAAHPKDDAKDTTINQAFKHVVSGADCKKPIEWLMGFALGEDEWRIGSDAMRWNGEEAILVYDWCHDQMTAEQKKTIVARWNGYIDHTMAMPWGGPTMTSNNYYWGYLRNEIEWGIATYGDNPPASKYLDFALVKRWKDNFLPFSAGTHKPRARLDGRGGVPQEGTQYGVYMASYPIVPFATASLLENFIDAAEKRAWFLFEASRLDGDNAK